MAKKPLIFVEPLSDTFKKLQEVLAPITEAEGFEIFTTANINEAMQLIPNVDASLTLLSDPKITALLLKGQGKKIAKQNSKIMLLSKQGIPQKSLEKMMKYGLSECVVEPIQPKSLLYKVKLLLRSLPSQDKQEKELSLKSGEGALKKEEEKKQEGEETKDLANTENILPEEQIEKTPSTPTAESESYLEGKVKNQNEDNGIDSHYQGKISKDKIEKTEEEDLYKRPENEKQVDSHYKGSLTESKKNEEQNNNDIKNSTQDIIDDRLKGKLGENNLELEADAPSKNIHVTPKDLYHPSQSKRPQDLNLDLESEQESKNKYTREADDKYLKGKMQDTQQEDSADEKNNSTKMSFLLENEQNLTEKSDNHSLNLEKDESKQKNTELNLETEKNEKKKESSNGLELEGEDQKHSKTQNLAQEEDYLKEYKSKNKDEQNGNSDNQMYQRNKEKKDQDITSRQSSSLDLELEKDKELNLSDNQNEEDIQKKKKAEQSLNFEQEDGAKKDKSVGSDSQDLYQNGEKKNKSLASSDANQIEDQKSVKSSTEEENIDGIQKGQKIGPDVIKRKKNKDGTLDLEKDDYYQMDKEQKEQDDSKKKEWIQRTEEEKKEHQKEKLAEQEMGWKDINLDKKIEEDKIKKEKSQEEERHWENIKINKKQDILESEKSQYDKEMIIKKEERGEQTIDYAKLKEEFGIIDQYGRDAIKNAYSFGETGGVPGAYSNKVRGALPYSVEINETPEENHTEEDIISSVDFPPDSKGLEHAVNILNFIENKRIKEEEIFVQIGQTILQEYSGHSVFFRSDVKTYQMENIYKVDSDYIRQQYETFKHLYFDMWKSIPLPYWSDETFQSKEIFFIFPFFEGTKSLGFAVSFFPQGIKQEITPRVEILFECARTLYLDYAHDNATKGTYIALANKKEKEEETTVGKVFGKLTSWFKKAG